MWTVVVVSCHIPMGMSGRAVVLRIWIRQIGNTTGPPEWTLVILH